MLVYRHEDYLAEAIESVLAQVVPWDFELVIGEDRSPDRCIEIARRFQKSHPHRVRVLQDDHNVGAFLNSYRTISACRGSYIAFCEGDDYWQDPNKLAAQVEIMQADPGISVCHSDFDRRTGFRTKKQMHRRRPPRFPAQGLAYENLLRGWSAMTATLLFRGDVLRDFLHSQFNRSDYPFGDYNKLLYASLRGRVAYLPQSTATWRKVPGSASNAGTSARLRLMTAALECRQLFMHHHPPPPEVERQALGLAYQDIAKAAFLAGETSTYSTAVDAMNSIGWRYGRVRHWARTAAIRLVFPLKIVQIWKRIVLSAGTWTPSVLTRWASGKHRVRREAE